MTEKKLDMWRRNTLSPSLIALFVSTKTPGGEGLMRFVADNPDKAINTLNSNGIEVQVDEVLAAETPHHAGGLLAVLNPLKRAKVNVSYLYPCIQTGEATILILGAERHQGRRGSPQEGLDPAVRRRDL